MNKKTTKICTLLTAVMMSAAMFTACGSSNSQADEGTDASSAQSTAANTAATADGEILNFTAPVEGEKIAVITVADYGEIKIKLFPEAAPKGVENFIGLADANYYDELIFHRIIPDFMIQGGDPRGDGTGGQSMWGGSFDGGVSDGLYHFTGAVAYANSGATSTNGSQFYIVNTDDGYMQYNCEELMQMDQSYSWPQNVVDMYTQKGGTPFLDGGYTVFGQVFEGIDVVRAIAAVDTDDNDKPLTQVKMESVRIVEYTGE